MRVHIQSERRNSGIMNVVLALRDSGVSFSEIVNKISKQFHLSQEIVEREIMGYWKER